MQPIFAIVTLTWKAAFRYRLFWVIVVLLLGAVTGLPLLIKDDGTAQGFAQILITYTLGAVTALLGLCTLWLACGTLARDVEECQIQMVVVKPIARWQVWVGKWLGLVSLNAVLLGVAGLSIYGLLEWRSRNLPPEQVAKLRNEVLVARASAREESLEPRIQDEVEGRFRDRIAKTAAGNADTNMVRQQIEDQVRAEVQVVPPGQLRFPPWFIHLRASPDRLRDKPLYMRVKFNSAQATPEETVLVHWKIGDPRIVTPWETPLYSLAPDTFHEIEIKPNLFDEKGDLVIVFHNPNQNALLFPLNEGLEVLYREGSFGLNFVRGLGVILCWMALLAALGMAAASFLSFPVAAFASLALLLVVFSSGTISTAVTEGTVIGFDTDESYIPGRKQVDFVLVKAFKGILEVINLVRQFSPIDSLSTGRSITWSQLGLAVTVIVLIFGGLLASFGIFAFHRRELATAQGTT